MQLTKLCGGGTSWFYLISGTIIIDAAHEDDKAGMERLKKIQEAFSA